MKFDHSFLQLPNSFYSFSTPAIFQNPELIIFNKKLAHELELNLDHKSEIELSHFFSGQKQFFGSQFFSQVYAGHQFAQFVPRLGDGRAIMIGEVLTSKAERFDVQLKGAGPTTYSRRGDGFSALGPVLREYLVSEFMNAVAIKTTRALCAVKTHHKVYRDQILDGGVFTRVAKSHLRIGSFQYFLGRNETDNLKTLLNYAINRHYPSLIQEKDFNQNRALLFINEVAKAQSHLIGDWLGIGFIHGVMNTDNTSISGETLDYGPCAFMDTFNFDQVYSFIDRDSRYAYANQPEIILWNLARLADCMIPILKEDQNISTDQAIEKLNDILKNAQELMESKSLKKFSQKIYLTHIPLPEQKTMTSRLLSILQSEQLDFTLSFRQLSKKLEEPSFKLAPGLDSFYNEWIQILKRENFNLKDVAEIMNCINPIYIPRNHLVEKAIDLANNGDFSFFHQLHLVLSSPFKENLSNHLFAQPPTVEEIVANTFCGT